MSDSHNPIDHECGAFGNHDSDPDHCILCCRFIRDKLLSDKRELVEAMQALGFIGEGYCFCRTADQVGLGHTGECRVARALIEKLGGGR